MNYIKTLKCFLLIAIIIFHSICSANNFCSASNLEENSADALNQIINKCIELNENFKKSVGKSNSDTLKKRRMCLEGYYESYFLPNSDCYIDLIGSKKNGILAYNFLKMIISYRNSADEKLPYVFAKVFLLEPDFISGFFKSFSVEDRKHLYYQLEFGWKQVANLENPHPVIVSNRSQKLRQLNNLLTDK